MQTPITQFRHSTTEPFSWDDLFTSQEITQTFHSSFDPIHQYIYLARNTESPRQYHLWSLLSLTAALGSNVAHIDRGIIGRVKLNLGVVLSGRPTIRKSSAITFMQRFATGLPLNYGPTDTGGARQGIMSAMQSRWQDDIRDEMDGFAGLEELAASNFDNVISRIDRRSYRPSSIYFTAKELGRLLTAQTRELLDFFNDGIDGEPIFYQTKAGTVRIPSPLINLLGATTPGSLPHILPRDAYDHGFLSRLIFVYASKQQQRIPHPPAFTDREINLQEQLYDVFTRITTEANGRITFDQRATELYESLYAYSVPSIEFRLNAYAGRRAEHLAKLSALICILRGQSPYVISPEDVGLAHVILILTEQTMDGAYAGLDRSPDGRAYAFIREAIESVDDEALESGVIHNMLTRSGIFRTAEEHIGLLTRLKSSGRLTDNGRNICVAKNTDIDRVRMFLDSFKKRYGGA